ncbi:MAG: terminase, partial [Desulfobulbaceae bacterium]|nr:terminase [Desulfobulbaceae bacterium]
MFESAEKTLRADIGGFKYDPLGFVMYAYPWGVEGTSLEKHTGPDKWQRDFLIRIGQAMRDNNFDGFNAVKAIREATASGHGIGKSAL